MTNTYGTAQELTSWILSCPQCKRTDPDAIRKTANPGGTPNGRLLCMYCGITWEPARLAAVKADVATHTLHSSAQLLRVDGSKEMTFQVPLLIGLVSYIALALTIIIAKDHFYGE